MSGAPGTRRPHGAREWIVERVALAVLLPLGLWLAASGWSLLDGGYEAAQAWASNGLNAGLLAVAVVVFMGFAALAWKVIIEDYLHGPAVKLALAANYTVCLGLALAGLFFILSIALGSAPLGA